MSPLKFSEFFHVILYMEVKRAVISHRYGVCSFPHLVNIFKLKYLELLTFLMPVYFDPLPSF